MRSSHHGGELFTAMKNPVGRTVRRDSTPICIKDLKYYTIFHADSENISFMERLSWRLRVLSFGWNSWVLETTTLTDVVNTCLQTPVRRRTFRAIVQLRRPRHFDSPPTVHKTRVLGPPSALPPPRRWFPLGARRSALVVPPRRWSPLGARRSALVPPRRWSPLRRWAFAPNLLRSVPH
jgi:hypothetical protein